jgi:hypothetical protein
MVGYHVDCVGALTAGAASAIVFVLLGRAFPKLTGAILYIVLALLVAAVSLALRELLRHAGV